MSFPERNQPQTRWRRIPNALSLCRMGLAIPLYVAVARGHAPAAFILLVLAGILDVTDGALARRWNCQTGIGSTLDTLADFSCAVAFVTGLFGNGHLRPGMIVVLALTVGASLYMLWRLFRLNRWRHIPHPRAAKILGLTCLAAGLLVLQGRAEGEWLFLLAIAGPGTATFLACHRFTRSASTIPACADTLS